MILEGYCATVVFKSLHDGPLCSKYGRVDGENPFAERKKLGGPCAVLSR